MPIFGQTQTHCQYCLTNIPDSIQDCELLSQASHYSRFHLIRHFPLHYPLPITLSQNENSKRVLDRFMLIKLTKFWRSSKVREQWQWQCDTILHWLFVLSLERFDQSKSAYVRGLRKCTEGSDAAVDKQRSLHNFVSRASSMKTSNQKLKSARFCSRWFRKSAILTKKKARISRDRALKLTLSI